MALTPYQSKVIADGASNYWPLNETSGTTATDIIGGKNGTISGGVTLGQPGASAGLGTAMAFDGTGQITYPTVTLGTTCTIELWFKPTATATDYIGLFGNAAGGISVYYHTGNFINCFAGGNHLNTTPLTLSSFTHVVIAISAGTGTFYINGVVNGTFTGWPGRDFNMLAGTTTDKVTGLLQQAAIYPLALTPAQIAAHYAIAFVSLGAPIRTRVDRPFNRYTAIITSDTVNLFEPTLALYVGTAGDVVAVEQDGLVRTFAGVPAGSVLVVKAIRVMATGTTAGALVALNRV